MISTPRTSSLLLNSPIRQSNVSVSAGHAWLPPTGSALRFDHHGRCWICRSPTETAQFFQLADQAESFFRQGNVDGIVLVDFPGFNWHIAKRAHRLGIPVFYYLPPQLWAWGSWRVSKIKKYVDRVLCNLPFEKDWFAKHGVNADYVGHPFF